MVRNFRRVGLSQFKYKKYRTKSLRTGHFVPYHRVTSPFAQGIPSHTIGHPILFSNTITKYRTKSLHTGHPVPSHRAFRPIPSDIASFRVPSHRAFRSIPSDIVSFQVPAYGYPIPSHRVSSSESNGLPMTKKGNKSLFSTELPIIKRGKSPKSIGLLTNKRIKSQGFPKTIRETPLIRASSPKLLLGSPYHKGDQVPTSGQLPVSSRGTRPYFELGSPWGSRP